MPNLPFTVAAGKYDGYERNCKYIESFATLDDAIVALLRVSDYPWSHIEYKGYRLDVSMLVISDAAPMGDPDEYDDL